MSLLDTLIPLVPATNGIKGKVAYKLRSRLWLEVWRMNKLFSIYLQPDADTDDIRMCVESYPNIDPLTAECVLQEMYTRFPEEFERIINGKPR